MYDPENDHSLLWQEQPLEDENSATPDSGGKTRLIYELEALYAEKNRLTLQRVWERLGQQYVAPGQLTTVSPILPQQRRVERISTMQPSMKVSSPHQRKLRFLSQIAAILVCALLVGGLALVLGATRSKTPATSVGTHGPASATCKNAVDQSEQALCTQGQETMLNIPLAIGTTKVTFVRAYADPARLILIYSAPHAISPFALHRLETRQGSLVNVSETIHISGTLYEVNFLPSDLPTSATQFQVQGLVVAVNTGYGGTLLPLHFTLPVHTAQRVVPINKTETRGSIHLTLKRIVITGSATLIDLAFAPLLPKASNVLVLGFSEPTVRGPAQVFPAPNTNRLFLLDRIDLVKSGVNTVSVTVSIADTKAPDPATAPWQTYTWTFQFTASV